MSNATEGFLGLTIYICRIFINLIQIPNNDNETSMNLTKLLSQGLVAKQQTKLLVRAKESNQHNTRLAFISRREGFITVLGLSFFVFLAGGAYYKSGTLLTNKVKPLLLTFRLIRNKMWFLLNFV